MYAVVGCGECQALWIVEGRPETTQCPRCGRRRAHEKRRRFVETDDEDHAREVRAGLLAERQDHGEAFADLDSVAAMGERVDEAGVDDEAYLAEHGIDPESVAEAGERAERGQSGGQSRKAIVLEAVETLEAPAEDDVVAYADERGVPADYVSEALQKLVRAGELSEHRGAYRRV